MSLVGELVDDLLHPHEALDFVVSAIVFLLVALVIWLVVWLAYTMIDEALGEKISGTGIVRRHGVEGAYVTPIVAGRTIVNQYHPAQFFLEVDIADRHTTQQFAVSPETWSSTPDGASFAWRATIGRFSGDWYTGVER